jgi:hypothetical protein
MKILLVFILSLCSCAYAQKAAFKEIKLKPSTKFYAPEGSSIIYPIIVTADPKVDQLINTQIKDELLNLDSTKQTARTLLTEHINEYGLVNLSYEVIYNNHAILSLQVYEEGCGAYCSSGDSYFNFDLTTGKKIAIADLIKEEMLDSFRNIVFHDKLKALQEYKLEEIEDLKQGNTDSSTYDWAMQEVDSNCSKSVSLESFSLPGLIQVFDRCEFPHAIQSQQPTYELKYSYRFLQPFLKPKFKQLLK